MSEYELDLIEQLRKKEHGAMAELLRRHGPLMRYIVAPILLDEREREECISDVAMRVWDKIEQYEPEKGNWLGWLTAITRNTALNRARQNQKEGVHRPLKENLTDSRNQPEEQALRQERAAALKRALTQLSFSERALFYRKYYYLQSTAQIAAELGMTERAVEGKLYRIKKQLRERLGGEGFA